MVHLYKLNGYQIVLDTCSGSVHTVDDVAYDVIALYEGHSEEEIVSLLLEKYKNRPDVTREELLLCLEDVRALSALGIYGAIVGRAYYTGAISLPEAIEVAK